MSVANSAAKSASADSALNSTYTVDLTYASPFVLGQLPLQLQWAAATAGAPTSSLTEPFTYCDLGCGDGRTLNIIAAAYPQASFIGIDLNPEHIGQARDLAQRAGLENVSFHETSFADLGNLKLPAFDYIALHGVYSWVDASMRAPIHDFVQQMLKPGGLFCLHYASLPGSALHDAVFHYLQALSVRASGNSAERFTSAVLALRKLMPVSQFFARNAQAPQLVEEFRKHAVETLTHDVLNHQPHSYFFDEVHAAMSGIGLQFLGSADLQPNYPELMLSQEAYSAFAALTADTDPVFRESIKDLMLNTDTRSDVYRKPSESDADHPEPCGLRNVGDLLYQRSAGDSSRRVRYQASMSCAADLGSDLHTAILDAGPRPRPIREVLDGTIAASYGEAETARAFEQLFAMGYLDVLIRPTLPVSESGADVRYGMASRLNRLMLEERIGSVDPVPFASPVLGSPIMVPLDARLRLLAALGGDLAQAWEGLRRQKVKLTDSAGSPLESLDAFRGAIEQTVPAFESTMAPDLVSLGVLEELS